MKRTYKTIKKILSIIICLALVMSYVPILSLNVSAAASDLTVTIDTGASVTLKDTDGDKYYEIGTADELYAFAAAVNGGSNTINGELTSDIVVNTGVLVNGALASDTSNFRTWTPIGDVTYRYSGSFDGAGKTVSGLYFNNTSSYYIGFFGLASKATIKNVGVVDSYFCGKDSVGGVVAYLSASSDEIVAIECCYFTGVVSGNWEVGGVAGSIIKGVNGTVTVSNCYNTGTVSGTLHVGGVGGRAKDNGSSSYGTLTISNCYSTGTVSGTTDVGGVFGYVYENTTPQSVNTITNCYFDSSKYSGNAIGLNDEGGVEVTNTIGKTSAQFASGEVAYLLQGSQTEQVWGQTIGSQTAPVLGGTKVYQLTCGGDTTFYSNSNTNYDEHNYNKVGICTICGAECLHENSENGICQNGCNEPAILVTEENYESLELSADYVDCYAIGNAGQLIWFAEFVNAGNKSANAIVIADIDMTGVTFTPIAPVATLNYSNTTYEDTGYTGTFDGGCHTISNLTITRDSEKQATVGMFGTVSGTVKNLHLDKASYALGETVDGRFSVFVGQLLPGGTITDCVVSNSTVKMDGQYVAGAVAGCNYGGTITNCVSYNNSVDPNARCGNLVGDNQNDSATAVGKVNYCYSTSTLAGGNGGSGTVTNSLSGINGNVVLKIVYLLNSNSDCEWKIKDGVPCFAGDTVYQNTCEGDIFYATNDEDHEAHSLGADFRCTLCGRYDAPTLSGSYYQIATPSNLFWFAEEVNDGNNAIYGQLKNHIDLNNVEWVSIGDTDSPFKGNFDGGNYIISGYKQTITKQGDYGLFGTVNTGNTARRVTIKNFTIIGEAISNIPAGTTGGSFRYGVIGYIFYGTVENVHSSVNLTIKDSNYKDCVGGIVGTSESGEVNEVWYWNYIRRCSFSGKLDLGTAQVNTCGGMVGYVGYNSTFKAENCLFDGTIHSDYTSPLQIGGIMGYNRGLNVWFLNCLSVGTIDLVNTNFAGAIAGRYLTSTNVVLTKNKVANNYYSGTLPAFSNTTDSSIGWYNIDITDYAEYTEACAKLVTADQLATGEIAYLLQSGNTSQVWGQQSNQKDAYPVLDATGLYKVVTVGETGGYSVANIGDTNADGTVNATDYQAVVNQAISDNHAQSGTASYNSIIKYDIDGDGYVDVLDASLIERMINGYKALDVYAVGDYNENGVAFEEADLKNIKHAVENPEKLSTSEKYASDINGDGKVSEDDLTKLTIIHGEITATECADTRVYYSWDNKYSTCTAIAMCTLCGETYSTETVKTTSETLAELTCTQDGKTKYTATFTNELFEEQVKNVTIDMLGHDYENGVCTQCGMGPYTYDQATNTYTVYHVDGLYAWNTAAQTDLSTNLVLMADITLPNKDLTTGNEITVENGVPSGSNWTPISTAWDKGYTGTFDGNNHTISGLRINTEEDYASLIGILGADGELKNLTLANAVVYGTGSSVSGFVAYISGGTISGCTFGSSTTDGSSVSGTGSVGGIIHNNVSGLVSYCINNGTISASGTYAEAGGIAAQTTSNGTVSNCINNGSVSVSGDSETICTIAGGIVGYTKTNSTVSGCTNNGSVSATGVNISAGGIVGWNANSTVSGCENTGKASGTGSERTYLAGIVGFNSNGTVDDTNVNKGEPTTIVGNG